MEMYEFTFELYDPERTGELRFSQVRALIRIIHDSGRDGESKKGEHLKKGHQDPVMKQLGQFLDILGIPDEARITRTNFVGICEKFPALVSPVVTLQVWSIVVVNCALACAINPQFIVCYRKN